jgi:serine/threonine protein kinase/WD40 repeat protein
MSDLTAPPSPEEELLVQFADDFSKAGNRAELVAQYCQRHPELAARLREQAALIAALDRAGAAALPARLGDFRIVRELKREGMGVILEAEQEPLGRRVAVKIIRPDRVSPSLEARFRREQKVLAALHQTHIVPIHAAGTEGDLHYFAMPFLKGATLQEVIQSVSAGFPGETQGRIPTLAEVAERLSDQAGEKSTASGSRAAATRLQSSTPGAGTRPQSGLEPAGQSRRTLSPEYFRSVAQYMAEAAEALEHAHALKILHRDIKPSNLMVDVSGNCWIIDFGLATFMEGAARPASAGKALSGADELISEAGTPGTPPYMAPEQWKKAKLDGRTDVWGLGVTLYELLALRRAFTSVNGELEEQVLHQDPPPPRTRVRNAPSGLAAICRKAMSKDPARRYPKAGDFADDLKRWLRGEPLESTGVFRRVGLWARRNKGWAAALCLAMAGSLAFAVGFGEYQERAQEGQRQYLMRQMAIERQIRNLGWSDRSWELVRQGGAIRKDDHLRNQAAASLGGLDARVIQEFKSMDASAVLFDPKGRRLLIGGSSGGKRPPGSARIRDLATGESILSKKVGAGPVAFRGRDGTPLHVVVNPRDRLAFSLWDLSRQQPVREFKIPDEEKATPLSAGNAPMLALTRDGALLAVAADLRGGKRVLVVWDVETGKILRRDANIDVEITALAVNQKAGLVAAGNREGGITLWPLPDGKRVPLSRSGRTAVQCLAIQRGTERNGAKEKSQWLLAAGDAGGTVTIWDLEARTPKTHCHGSKYAVHTVAFSPDGATLASGGRGGKLWDIATGKLVLNLPSLGGYLTGLAFSPDGRKLAGSNKTVFGGEGGVAVCELEYGRGIQSLRGLSGQVSKVRMSPGGKYLAALAHNWQVGIWDLDGGSLRHVLDVPVGFAVDNAALAFSPDGRCLAFASGREAQLWDLDKGQLQQSWKLPPGLQDALAFNAGGKRLMLCRWETQGGIEPPFGDVDFRKHPRVYRVRDLLGPDPVKEVAHIPINERIFFTAAARDASYFLLMGEGKGGHRALTQVFSGFTANKLLSVPGDAGYLLDPTGKILALAAGGVKFGLLEMPSGKLLETWDAPHLSCLSPGARFWGGIPDAIYGCMLGRGGDKHPLVTLGIDFQVPSDTQFSDDGRLLAWGNADGTVMVCDHQEVQRHLAEVGLGWE